MNQKLVQTIPVWETVAKPNVTHRGKQKLTKAFWISQSVFHYHTGIIGLKYGDLRTLTNPSRNISN